MSRSGKNKNRSKQIDDKQNKLKFNLPKKYFDQKNNLDL